MNPTNSLVYTVPDQFAGKTYRQIQQNEGKNLPGIGEAKFDERQLGISADQALNAGQEITYRTDDPGYLGSGLYQSLNQLFGKGMSQEQAAVKPVVKSLEASKSPIQERYKTLIDSIKGNQQTATNRQTVSTANELGRRGIQGGGLYDQTFADSLNPITQQYTGMLQNANTQQSADLNQVDQLIAQIQSGASKDSIQNALTTMQMQQQAKQNADRLDLERQQMAASQSESAANRAFQERQAGRTDPYANLLNVGGKIYNAQTGQWITPPSSASANSGWD